MLFTHHHSNQSRGLYLLALISLLFFSGCFHEFYKVQRKSLDEFRQYGFSDTIIRSDYFILHGQEKAMHLSEVYLTDGYLHGTLSELPANRIRNPRLYQKPVRYRPNEKYILEEVHLFLHDDIALDMEQGEISIPDLAISEVYLYDEDLAATSFNHAMSIMGLAATGIVIANADWDYFGSSPSFGNIESCPFVYAQSGLRFRLQGEIFAGAIFPQLERHDYLPLPDLKPVDHAYQLQITNEQPEHHYINLANLIEVDHPEGTEVLLDASGVPHTIADPQIPVKALAPNGHDLLPQVKQQDFNVYFYEEGDQLYNYVDLSFEKPAPADAGKLVLSARSSHWSTLMFSSITEMLGNAYPRWTAQMAERPTSEIQQMMDAQGLRMGVYLWTENSWQLIDRIEQIGPVAFRKVVIPIDLSDHREDTVRVKIEGGHLFWEMDYAAMDYTPNLDLRPKESQPGYAVGKDGTVYTKALGTDDRQYVELPSEGQEVRIWYPAFPARPGFQTSVFLHSKGYYKHLREYHTEPDMVNFPQLDQPGTFIQYSRDRFTEYMQGRVQ